MPDEVITTTQPVVAPRMLKEAKRQAILLSNRIKAYHQTGKIKAWSDLESLLKIKVPTLFSAQPFTYQNVCGGLGSFCNYWEISYEERLKASLTVSDSVAVGPIAKLRVDHAVDTFGKITLYQEQQPVFRRIYDLFFPVDPKTTPPEHSLLQDGYPGLGKTVIAAAVIAQCIKDGWLDRPDMHYCIQPFMIFTPKTLIEHWTRVLEDFGLSEYLRSGKIKVFSNSLFMSEFGSAYVDTIEDFYTGDSELKWNIALIPLMVVLDESHQYNNKDAYRTRCMEALYRLSKRVRFLQLSGTPGEKVNDMYLFTITTRKNLLGTFVDPTTFKYFSQLITPRPDRATKESMKRFRKTLQSNIISAPYVKPPHKAINVLELCDFNSAKDKLIHDTLVERYLENCRKLGKNTAFGRFRRNVELAIFRRGTEPLRAPHIAARCAENFNSGNFATAVGTEFKETITDVAFLLVDKYRIGREHISIIWGGKKEYKKESMIPPQELAQLMRNPGLLMKKLESKRFRSQFALSIRYEQDQVEHGETLNEQDIRHMRLKELNLLGTQSLNKRQIEIDNFQDSTTKICLFTAATGGVGLSLDKNVVTQLPREGLFSMGYSGKVFRQLLNRLVRRNSIADAIQRICAMRDTVEHWFLAPLMDRKLKCIAELVSSDLEVDIEALMAEQPAAKNYAARDLQQAMEEAEHDNTIVNELVATDRDDDDEESDQDLVDSIVNPNTNTTVDEQ